MSITVVWSKLALAQSQAIVNYLEQYFTQREIDRFYDRLNSFENLVTIYPDLYLVINEKEQIRRAVLSKPLSVFYIYTPGMVEVVGVLDNRMNTTRWPGN